MTHSMRCSRIAFTSLVFIFSSPGYGNVGQDVFQRAGPSVFVIRSYNADNQPIAQGSAVAVTKNEFVTNCHVIEDAARITVGRAKDAYDATVIWADRPRDLCQVRADSFTATPAVIRAFSELTIGEQVFAVGSPLGLELTLSAGLLSTFDRHTDLTLLVISAPISPGSSGGGLFDSTGRLIGITTRWTGPRGGFNIAVPAELIADLPKRSSPLNATDPGDRNWYQTARQLEETRQYKRLAELAEQWTAHSPGNHYAWAFLGEAAEKADDFSRMATAFERARHLNPAFPWHTLNAGIAYNRLGRSADAIESLSAALKDLPTNARGWRALGESYYREKKWSDCAVAYEQSRRLMPNDSAMLIQLSNCYIELKKFGVARETLESHIRLNDSADARYKLGHVQFELAELDNARTSLKKAVDLDSNHARAWLYLGFVSQHRNQHDDAMRAFREAVRIDPTLAPAWHNLGTIFARSNQHSQAVDAFRKALATEPNRLDSMTALGFELGADNRPTESASTFERIIALAPTSFDAWRGAAAAYTNLRQLDRAETAYRKAVGINDKDADVWRRYAGVLQNQKKFEDALTALDHALALKGEDLDVLREKATTYGLMNRTRDALPVFEKIVQLQPIDAIAWSNLGYARIQLGLFDAAIEPLQTAVKLDPNFVNAWINLADAQYRMKQVGKSIDSLRKATALAPESYIAWYRLGIAHSGLNQLSFAINALRTAVRLRPEIPDGWIALGINLAANDELEAAREALEKALTIKSDVVPALFALGSVYSRQGNIDGTRSIHEKLKPLDPARANAFKRTYLKQE